MSIGKSVRVQGLRMSSPKIENSVNICSCPFSWNVWGKYRNPQNIC